MGKCKFNTEKECTGNDCDRCYRHPMYRKGMIDLIDSLRKSYSHTSNEKTVGAWSAMVAELEMEMLLRDEGAV